MANQIENDLSISKINYSFLKAKDFKKDRETLGEIYKKCSELRLRSQKSLTYLKNVKVITEKEYTVLVYRFCRGMSLEVTSIKINRSRERIRQIEHLALLKIDMLIKKT